MKENFELAVEIKNLITPKGFYLANSVLIKNIEDLTLIKKIITAFPMEVSWGFLYRLVTIPNNQEIINLLISGKHLPSLSFLYKSEKQDRFKHVMGNHSLLKYYLGTEDYRIFGPDIVIEAVKSASHESVMLLLQYVNLSENPQGYLVIHAAARKNDYQLMKKLLAFGVYYNPPDTIASYRLPSRCANFLEAFRIVANPDMSRLIISKIRLLSSSDKLDLCYLFLGDSKAADRLTYAMQMIPPEERQLEGVPNVNFRHLQAQANYAEEGAPQPAPVVADVAIQPPGGLLVDDENRQGFRI